MKPNGYFSQIRHEMSCFVPLTARRILEIGCGAGLFASQFVRDGKEVWGIESNANAAERASKILTKVICGDVNEKIKELPENYFDVIVCNDVLEHLAYPIALLRVLKNKFTQNGIIVVSLPNMRYLPVLWNLVVYKNWHYTDQGVLDRTHLRFFTKKTILEFFDDAEYEIIKLEGINPILSWKFSLFNLATLGFFSDTKFLQFAILAKIKSRQISRD